MKIFQNRLINFQISTYNVLKVHKLPFLLENYLNISEGRDYIEEKNRRLSINFNSNRPIRNYEGFKKKSS